MDTSSVSAHRAGQNSIHDKRLTQRSGVNLSGISDASSTVLASYVALSVHLTVDVPFPSVRPRALNRMLLQRKADGGAVGSSHRFHRMARILASIVSMRAPSFRSYRLRRLVSGVQFHPAYQAERALPCAERVRSPVLSCFWLFSRFFHLSKPEKIKAQ